MLAAVVLYLHLRAEERCLRHRPVRAHLPPGGEAHVRHAHAVNRHAAANTDVVGAVVRHLPRVVQVQQGAQDAVPVFHLLQAAVLVEHVLDEPHRHRQTLVLRQAESLPLRRVHRHPERQIRQLLRRPRHHLVRREEAEHPVGNAQLGRESLVEAVAQLVRRPVQHETVYLRRVAVKRLHHLVRRDGNRLETFADTRVEVYLLGFPCLCHLFLFSLFPPRCGARGHKAEYVPRP